MKKNKYRNISSPSNTFDGNYSEFTNIIKNILSKNKNLSTATSEYLLQDDNEEIEMNIIENSSCNLGRTISSISWSVVIDKCFFHRIFKNLSRLLKI